MIFVKVAFRHPPVFKSLGRPRGPYLCVVVLKARDWLCFLPPHKTVGHHSPRATFLGTHSATEGVSRVSWFRRRWGPGKSSQLGAVDRILVRRVRGFELNC